MNKLVKLVKPDTLIFEFLRSLNGILNITEREMELLSKLIELDMKYDPTLDESKNVISTRNRKIVMQELGITADNLSRYIKKFKKKGILVNGKADDEVFVNKALIPEIIKDRVQLTLIFKISDEQISKIL